MLSAEDLSAIVDMYVSSVVQLRVCSTEPFRGVSLYSDTTKLASSFALHIILLYVLYHIIMFGY